MRGHSKKGSRKAARREFRKAGGGGNAAPEEPIACRISFNLPGGFSSVSKAKFSSVTKGPGQYAIQMPVMNLATCPPVPSTFRTHASMNAARTRASPPVRRGRGVHGLLQQQQSHWHCGSGLCTTPIRTQKIGIHFIVRRNSLCVDPSCGGAWRSAHCSVRPGWAGARAIP